MSSLPLLTRVDRRRRHVRADAARAPVRRAARAHAVRRRAARMPDSRARPGEQYRFHFDMGKCIGCKCCVVACNEQNGNPAAINWRRVGEIEGGWFPQRAALVPLDGLQPLPRADVPEGCPVDAYTKDPVTGIVRHSADACIGCQYCTWNCSYGVPQYNPERGVVGKCDMCHGRLVARPGAGLRQRVPEGAIEIEIVNIAEWRDVGRRECRARRAARRRRQPVDDADHAAGRSAAERAAASISRTSRPSSRTGRWW